MYDGETLLYSSIIFVIYKEFSGLIAFNYCSREFLFFFNLSAVESLVETKETRCKTKRLIQVSLDLVCSSDTDQALLVSLFLPGYINWCFPTTHCVIKDFNASRQTLVDRLHYHPHDGRAGPQVYGSTLFDSHSFIDI